MKDCMNWTQKLDGNTIDTKIVLDEYDRKAAKFEAVLNKFKPRDTVKYTGSLFNSIKNKIGVVRYVTLSAAGEIFVSVEYENGKYAHLLDPRDLSIINSKKQIKSEFSIKKVIFNKPTTIVFWEDGTKTVVKCGKRDTFDYEKGIAMAITKKAFGNTNGYYKKIKNFLPKEEEVKETKENPYGGTNYDDLSGAIKELVNSIFEVDHEDYS